MSLYPDTYEKELRNTTALQNSCTINDLIDHIFTESEKIFQGTAYEDNWYVYHDALSLLTSKKAVDYMKEKGYYKHLILPLFGLNDVINGSQLNAEKFVGNHF